MVRKEMGCMGRGTSLVEEAQLGLEIEKGAEVEVTNETGIRKSYEAEDNI
jgi:hypothetical protein